MLLIAVLGRMDLNLLSIVAAKFFKHQIALPSHLKIAFTFLVAHTNERRRSTTFTNRPQVKQPYSHRLPLEAAECLDYFSCHKRMMANLALKFLKALTLKTECLKQSKLHMLYLCVIVDANWRFLHSRASINEQFVKFA